MIKLNVFNGSPNLPRDEWVFVPCPVDALEGHDHFVSVDDGRFAILGEEFGADTGRQRMILTRVHLDPGESKDINLTPISDEDFSEQFGELKFRMSKWVSDDLPGILPTPVVFIEDKTTDQDPPAIVARRIDLASTEVVSDFACDVYHRFKVTARVPDTQLLYIAYVHIFTDQDAVQWESRIICSDPTNPEMDQKVVGLRFEAGEPFSLFCQARVGAGELKMAGADLQRWTVDLIDDVDVIGGFSSRFYMGYTHCIPEDLTVKDTLEAETQNRIAAQYSQMDGFIGATVAAEHLEGNYLAFGVLPEVAGNPRYSPDEFYAKSKIPGSYHEGRPMVGLHNAGGTGGQYPFGAAKGEHFGNGAFVLEMMLGFHSWVRPSALYEADGNLMRAGDRDLKTWSQLPDHRLGKDVFGKKLADSGWLPTPETKGFNGEDDQHMQDLVEAATTFLTGRPSFRDRYRERFENFLAGHPIDETWLGTRPGAARAVGRTFQFLANAYLILGDERIRACAVHRARNAVQPSLVGTGPMKIIGGPTVDPRALHDGDYNPLPCIVVWQEGLKALGARACHLVFGDPVFGKIAVQSGVNVALNSYVLPNGRWSFGDSVLWRDGQPLDMEEFGDNGNVRGVSSSSNDFMDWNIGSQMILVNMAKEDPELIDWTGDPGIVDAVSRARKIVASDAKPRQWLPAQWRAVR